MSVKANLHIIEDASNPKISGKIALKGKFALIHEDKVTFVGIVGNNTKPTIMNVKFVNGVSHVLKSKNYYDLNNIFLNIKDIERTRLPKQVSLVIDTVATKINKSFKINKNKEQGVHVDFKQMDISDKVKYLKTVINSPEDGSNNIVNITETSKEISILTSICFPIINYNYIHTNYENYLSLNDEEYVSSSLPLTDYKGRTTDTFTFLNVNSLDEGFKELQEYVLKLKKYNLDLDINSPYDDGNGYVDVRVKLDSNTTLKEVYELKEIFNDIVKIEIY